VKQFIEHLTGRVVLMKNEHDQNRDFPHTHSIRLPAQESHKQGNQIFCCESKKRISLQLLYQNRALLLRKMAAAPSCAQPAAPGLCARSKVSTSTCCRWCCRPCRSAALQPPWDPRAPTLVLLLKLEPDASLRQESRAKQNQRPTACVLPNA